MALSTGSRLGAHEIISLIGAGGMGEVYLAQDTRLNRRVAIKILPAPYSADNERIARFHREAQAIAALNHPGIAGIHDFAEASPPDAPGSVVHYLVLELIDGETLADRLRRGALPVEEALELARQITDAVQAAHDRGICHRDLKPANIKITPDGTVKVLDFGLAKFLESTPAAPAGLTHSPTLSLAGTLPGVVLGTAGYMSPEQAKGLEADQRSDVFSFGCILFEMLTGRQAFHGDSVSEILASVLKTEADFTQLPPRLNPRLVETLKRCLEKNPKKRWQAIGDVRLEIESSLGHGLVADQPASQSSRPGSPWRWVTVLVVGAIVSGALAGYSAWRLKPEPARTLTRFTVPFGQGQQLTGNSRRLLALSPDGQTLVYIANTGLFVRSMANIEIRPLQGNNGLQSITHPVFSPDGKWLVFIGDRALRRMAATGGAIVTICEVDGVVYGLSWEESGIAFGVLGKGVFRVAPNGGTPQMLVSTAADEIASNPSMLPGGHALLFSIKKLTEPSWDRGEVVVQPVDGGERKTLIKNATDGRYVPTGHLVYANGGTLFAARFDVDRLTIDGEATPILEGVRRAGLSADGTGTAQFAFASNGTMAYIPGPVTATDDADIALFDRNGGIQPLKLPPGSYASPRASRDGKWIVFERIDPRETNIWIYGLTGSRAPQRLTFGGDNRAPVWSPDSQWIAFQSDREGDRGVFRQRADGTGVAERLNKPEAGVTQTPQSWSPDGTTLLVSVQKAGGQPTLWTLSLKDRQLTPYSEKAAREAVFSPDGRWVAYQTTDVASRHSVYVEPYPRTGAQYLLPTGGSVGHPFWSPKGDEIIVNARSNESLVVPVVATTTNVAFGRPAPFARFARQEGNPATTRRNADMMPGGQQVVGLLFPGYGGNLDEAPRINVVLNWFDELRERVPVKK